MLKISIVVYITIAEQLNQRHDALLPMVETRWVLDSPVLCNSIMFHRIEKEVIVHKHNGLGSHCTRTFLFHLIQNMEKCH
jgi:hypothetical protein